MATDPVQRIAGDSGHITDHNKIHARVDSRFSVKEPAFGAAGDGVTNDTAAIQLAINAAQAAGGGTIFFPEGTYLLSSRVNVSTAPIHFQGVGRSSILKRANSANDHIVAFAGTQGGSVRDLEFDCNGANQTSNQETVVLDVSCHDFTISGNTFINSAGFAIFVNGTPTTRVNNMTVTNNHITALTTATIDMVTVVADGAYVADNFLSIYAQVGLQLYESNDVMCVGNRVICNTAGGQAIMAASNLNTTIVGNTISLPATACQAFAIVEEVDNVGARDALGTLIIGNTIRATAATSTGVQIAGTATRIVIAHNVAHQLQNFIVYASGAIDDVTIDGNQVSALGGSFEVETVTPTNRRRRGNVGVTTTDVGVSAVQSSVSTPLTLSHATDPYIIWETGAGVPVMLVRHSTDASFTYRFHVTAEGQMRWGPGSTVQDTFLRRSTTEVLQSQQNFEIGSSATTYRLRLPSTVNATTAVGTTGAGAALPATPEVYIRVLAPNAAGTLTTLVIPAYIAP